MDLTKLEDFATRHAAAWSSGDPDQVASFYAENGSLTVNGGTPAVGRAAISETAGRFMTGFPDMVVKLDRVGQAGDRAFFHWIWTGTNTGPGGTGKAIRMTGYEKWSFDADGMIQESQGHYDEAEYLRQVGG